MEGNLINGHDLTNMVEKGARMLGCDIDRINALNVFPVPDGDTGTNMKMTIDGGANKALELNEINIGVLSQAIARAMVLSARGNSGVILSQFFKGLSLGLKDKGSVNVYEFASAMISGSNRSYSVVSNPTEGTILTVMREAGERAYNDINDETTMEEYLNNYLSYAKDSLAKTPELLPVLKEAGVIDSGGAGFVLVIEGMLKAIKGEDVEFSDERSSTPIINTKGFNADSELSYGYCTEFILQLQNKKVNTKEFDLKIINDYLNTIGNSIVSFKDDDIIKVHVHTFTPGLVLTEMQKYGEFLTLKIENMNVCHTEHINNAPKRKHKKWGMVAVGSGEGIKKIFEEIGVDEVCEGGQTMNTSTNDFIKAFDRIDADNILVFPNNSNIIMAANQARDAYTKANIYVIPTKTLAEGYSAISMANFDSDNLDEILAIENEAISNVATLEITYSIRDASINNIDVKKNDFIAIYNHNLIASSPSRLECLKMALNNISDIDSKEVFTIICGKDVTNSEYEELEEIVPQIAPYAECYKINGNQDVYSYIIGIE